jgi:hypothetical protein
MGGVSLYGRSQLLAAFFIPDNFVAPDTIFVALTTDIVAPGSSGTDLVEPEDDAYVRAEYGIGSDFWGDTDRGGVTNTSGIYFPTITADWGEVVGWALCDQQDGGNVYIYGELLSSDRIVLDPDNDQTVVLGAGALVLRQT